MKKKILLLLFVFSLLFPFGKVEAKTLDDMYKQLAELKNEKAASQSKKQLTEKEMKQINEEIASINENIDQAKKDIEQAEEDIVSSQEQIKEKEAETKELLKFLQLSSGENVYLEYLFAAENYTDFIYRYSIVKQLSSYNENLMTELNTLITELEDKKIVLANKQKELEKNKSNLNTKLTSLGSQIKELDEDAVSIDDEIKTVQEAISYYESLNCGRYVDVTSCVKVPYGSSFKFPVAKGTITSNFGWRYIFGSNSFHNGIDISGFGEGNNVYAASDGYVAAIIYRASCGGNKIYIHHNINGTKYTTAYLHLLTMKVKVGDVVSQGQIIATSGGGQSTMSYDSCSTGSHLHFTIASGWYLGSGYTGYSTFVANSIDPRDIWPNLPAKGSGVYYYR